MSFFSNLFGKSKKNVPGSLSPNTQKEKPLSEPARGGTTLRKQEEAPFQPESDTGPELSALEMAERQDWTVKSLPVWKPGDEILGLYRVEDVLEGGMGRVYIAHHKGWNVKLAIKSPNKMMLSDRSNFARVLREANSWVELGLHPNIAYCYYVRSIEEVPHIFVEYVDGGNLRQWISDGKCIDYQVSLDLAIQFCHGMEYAHSKGMIHRDIKPENVLMTKEGVLKITDFGLVRTGAAISDSKGTAEELTKGMTRIGDVMGTEGFMAPEQFTDATGVDERADIFSFGVCLYEMCCGARPYDITIGERREAPDPISLSRDKKFPPALAEVLTKCVQWEPDKRYRTFNEIRERLNTIYLDLFHQESPYAELELVDFEADSLNNRGVSYFELGRRGDALSCWEQAIKLNPMHLEATYNLSLSLWRNRNIDHLEVLKRLENCEKNPSAKKHQLADFKAFIHAESLDFKGARNVLAEYTSRYEALFPGRDAEQEKFSRNLEGHNNFVNSFRITYDSRYAISCSSDKTLRVWELETGRCVRILEGHKGKVFSVSLTLDGRYALSRSEDNTDRVWKLENGKCVRSMKRRTKWSRSVLTNDGRYTELGCSDNTLKVWELGTGQCICALKGHKGCIISAAFTANGKYVFSGSLDNTLRVWELETGRCIITLDGYLHHVVLSPDDQYAVLESSDHTLRVWELETGRWISTLEGISSGIAVITADNRYGLTCSGKTLEVWNFISGSRIHTLEGHTIDVASVAITPNGSYAVSCDRKNTIRVWELGSGRCAHVLHGYSVGWGKTSVAISPCGRFVVSNGGNKVIRVWEIESGRCLRTLQGHGGDVTLVAFSPDGRYVVSCSRDKTMKVWRIHTDVPYRAEVQVSFPKSFKEKKKEKNHLEEAINRARNLYKKGDYKSSFSVLYETWRDKEFCDNELITELHSNLMRRARKKDLLVSFHKKSFTGHSKAVYSVAITSDGRHVVSGSEDKTLLMWELGSGRCVHTMGEHLAAVWKIALTSESRYALTSSEKTLRVWDLLNGSCVHTLKGHASKVNSVAITHDGRYLVSGGNDKTVRIWELKKGQCIHTLVGHIGYVGSVATTPDSRYAVSSGSNSLRVWEIANGLFVRVLTSHSSFIDTVVISPDGYYAVSGGENGYLLDSLRLWEIASGRCVHILKGHRGRVTSIAFTPDGWHVVSGSQDNTLRVWELTSGKCVNTLEGHTGEIRSVSISPDGRYAVSGSLDYTLRVWEILSGRCISIMEGHTGGIYSVSISPDGRYVVSGSLDNTLRVWELVWGLEFPDPRDWDKGVRPYLEIFLTLRNGKWGEEDFKLLIDELALKRGYGWVRTEGIRKELEKMTREYKPIQGLS